MNEQIAAFIALPEVGSQSAAAELLSVTQPTVSEWLRLVRPVPATSAKEIERISRGAIPADKVRPDARWIRVHDKAWPWHAAGRPVLDMTRAAA